MNESLEILEQTLNFARRTGDRPGEAKTLCSLGSTYLLMGEKVRSIQLLNESMELAHELGDSSTEAHALWTMCMIFMAEGIESEKTFDLARIALRVFEKLGDPTADLARSILANQRNAVTNPEQVEANVAFYHQEWDRAREQRDLLGEFKALGNLGYVYRKSKSAPAFVPARSFQLQLKVARKLKDPFYEAIAQSNLRFAQHNLLRNREARQKVKSKKAWWRFWRS